MSSTKKNTMKQGSLFSFFSKKPSANTTNNNNNNNNKGTNKSATQKKAPITPSKTSSSSSNKNTSAPVSPTISKSYSAISSTSATSTSNATKSTLTSSSKSSSSKSTSSSSNPKSKQEKLLSQLKVGTSIAVHWPDDDEYYNAKIASKSQSNSNANSNVNSNVYTLSYDDGEVETLDLTNEKFRIICDANDGNGSSNDANDNSNDTANGSSVISQDSKEDMDVDDDDDDDEEEDPLNRKKSTRTNKVQNLKKRKILYDSDEEAEFDDGEHNDNNHDNNHDNDDDDAQSDASEFIVEFEGEEDEDEYDGISMKMTEDEDEDVNHDVDEPMTSKSKPKKPNVKRLRVTQVNENGTKSKSTSKSASFITPPPQKKKNKPSISLADKDGIKSNVFSSFASSSTTKNRQDQAQSQEGTSNSNSIREITPVPNSNFKSPIVSSSSSASRNATSTKIKIPLPQQGIVNQAGTHYHNHYTFLQPHKRRDGKNRPMSHPEYDPRTLKVDYNEMTRINGSKVTPAAQQWWEIKARYADTLLLFKTGKFYEIFHMDADIAVQALNFVYMKGQAAHAGFPEIGYGGFCEKLVKAGYKVARVEQTETPTMLKERKKTIRSGKKPSVVNREVCSIVSAGTRTFCYMDDVSCLEQQFSGGNNGNGIGPLLSVKEITVPVSSQSDSDDVQPVCEYGITIIDAATGEITLGQFADDILRSRMNTLLTKYCPSEILVENGSNGVSETLLSLIDSAKNSFLPRCQVEKVNTMEVFPKSTAIDPTIRAKMERPKEEVQPWDNEETLQELHRRGYFPRASRKKVETKLNSESGISRWPDVLKVCIQGGADLAISSLGAALFYLQRNLIDQEILTMGNIKGYIPPEPAKSITNANDNNGEKNNSNMDSSDVSLKHLISSEERKEDGLEVRKTAEEPQANNVSPIQFSSVEHSTVNEASISHLSLDGTTIANLEILSNCHSNTAAGSLWSKINFTKSPFGSRLLRAWLLRPLFRKEDIDRRADAVEELTSGGVAAAMTEARAVLAKCGDIERLLSRVHSMGYTVDSEESGHHPNERAVLYETATHTKRKVGDFSKLLEGLGALSRIPEIFSGVEIQSSLLGRLVHTKDTGGLFPSNLDQELDWFTNNFDCRKASQGLFELAPGMDAQYDDVCEEIDRIKRHLADYKNEMCEDVLRPRHVAKSQWKYANIKVDSKDKYLIELPITVQVPGDFIVKGKRGKGPKQINKYRTPVVEQLVIELEHAYDLMKERKARGIQMIFSKFDSMRSLWNSAFHASAMLDALGALAQASTLAGFCRPQIKECSPSDSPAIIVTQGRHPCVDFTHSGDDFIPNDLTLGGDQSRVLLLSGPNMGGKSTLLRQTCLIAILAQIGCFVPADECILTPFDRIFTRLGASDRILLGQSTFFVELAETAAALRGATRRSLCIFDELGRGTSTFDGTAIANATVKHLVEQNQCLTLFATHYHSLLEDWKDQPSVRLGHMECFVEDLNESDDDMEGGNDRDGNDDGGDDGDSDGDGNITFLYTLGEGSCPKSFGINVARLAGLPSDVLKKAKNVSSSFEDSLARRQGGDITMNRVEVLSWKSRLSTATKEGNAEEVQKLWKELQGL